MIPYEQANQLVEKFLQVGYKIDDFDIRSIGIENAKQCALICVNQIINSNPHSNPLNTDSYSTFEYWCKVREEIRRL